MGRHRVVLNPFRWHRRVALTVLTAATLFFSLSAAITMEYMGSAQIKAQAEPPEGVIIDNPGSGHGNNPGDLLSPVV